MSLDRWRLQNADPLKATEVLHTRYEFSGNFTDCSSSCQPNSEAEDRKEIEQDLVQNQKDNGIDSQINMIWLRAFIFIPKSETVEKNRGIGI